MARRRLIDPSIWQSGHSKRLIFRQRLLWLGVITMADDEGKLKGEPAVIKSLVFPFDKIGLKVIEADLEKLQTEGLIEQYEVGRDRYIRIVKWSKYQNPSHPTPSKIPDPTQNSESPPETLQNPSRNPPAQSSLGKDREDGVSKGQFEEQTAGSASASAGASAEPASHPNETTKPKGWKAEAFRAIGVCPQ